MFGLDFGELIVIGIVFLVVLGPHELPKMMRTLGRWVGRLRRMSSDLRRKSGIDEVIRDEGLERDIQTLRSLSRPRRLEALLGVDDIDLETGEAIRHAPPRAGAAAATTGASSPAPGTLARPAPRAVPSPAAGGRPEQGPDREYPPEGCDAYGARQPSEPRAAADDPYAPDQAPAVRPPDNGEERG